VEIPETQAAWQAGQGALAPAAGQISLTPEQRLFQARVVERTAKGYFSLANPYGSMMIILLMTAAALAADRWRRWLGQRQERDFLAAALVTLLALPAAASLVLTESKGAIAAGVVAAVAALAIALVHRWARRHWRVLVLASLAALAGVVAATAAYGARYGHLPSRSMQVRWEYWVASADIFRQHPLLGVGPGNFPDAYLAHRLPGAEESVKNPHNVLMQALSEYGLIGGGLFVGILVWALLAMAAPSSSVPQDGIRPANLKRLIWAWLFLAAGVVAWRLWAMHYPSGIVAAYENGLLIVMLLPALFVAAWASGPSPAEGLGIGPAIGLGCGLWGFFLHNLADFALFLPGAAMVFYAGAGALLAGTEGRTSSGRRRAAAPILAGLSLAAALLWTFMLSPALKKHAAVLEAAQHASAGKLALADAAMARAVLADPLDASTAAERAGLLLNQAQYELQVQPATRLLRQALEAMRLAVTRHPGSASYAQELLDLEILSRQPSLLWGRWDEPPPDLAAAQRQTATLLREHGDNPALLSTAAHDALLAKDFAAARNYLERALKLVDWPILTDHLGDVAYARGDLESARALWHKFQDGRRETFTLDPPFQTQVASILRLDVQNARLHIGLAQLAWQSGYVEQIDSLLAAAQAADDALPRLAVMRLTPEEHAQLALLKRKAAEQE
jgi:hypothetical protein